MSDLSVDYSSHLLRRFICRGHNCGHQEFVSICRTQTRPDTCENRVSKFELLQGIGNTFLSSFVSRVLIVLRDGFTIILNLLSTDKPNRIDCHYRCVNAVFMVILEQFEHAASCSIFLFVIIVVVKTYFEKWQRICF